MSEDTKKIILDTLDDQISRFLYYDRKEDSKLPVGAIEDAIIDGSITIYDLVKLFSDGMCASVGQKAKRVEIHD